MDAIVTFDLTKEYGKHRALDGLNLQVPQGEAFACVGGRGWGKTTLIRLLAGLDRPTGGECAVLGLSPSHEPGRLHSLTGTVLDSARLYGKLTLWENLRFFAGLHGMDVNDALDRSSFLLHRLDIWEGRDLPVEKLSTGVARRASLARALMHSPRLLLVDEPPGGLDQESMEAIREVASLVRREEGVTIFLCASNMEYAQALCGKFGLLRQGALLARGDMESLRQGAGVSYKAQLRVGPGGPGPEGFLQAGEFWEKEVDAEDAMPGLIAQAVEAGVPLYEARLRRPTLGEIYAAWLAGGKRKEAAPCGAEEPEPHAPEEATAQQPGEDDQEV